MNFPFAYHLAVDSLEVRLGPWTVRRIYYVDIADVRRGYCRWNEHWCNLWPLRYLTIRRKSGLIQNFLINPPDGDDFARRLRSRARLAA